MSRKDGGAAFPCTSFDEDLAGMSLRDYFAAKAMKALLDFENQTGGVTEQRRNVVAREAYEMADAMLKERAK